LPTKDNPLLILKPFNFATGWWYFLGTPVSSINKTDRHDITVILLKLALSTINLNQTISQKRDYLFFCEVIILLVLKK
jgi:hypothetical protein